MFPAKAVFERQELVAVDGIKRVVLVDANEPAVTLFIRKVNLESAFILDGDTKSTLGIVKINRVLSVLKRRYLACTVSDSDGVFGKRDFAFMSFGIHGFPVATVAFRAFAVCE